MKSGRYLRRVLCLSLVMLALGCGSDVPSNILEVNLMVPVVKDLQLSYAGIDATVHNPDDRPAKYEEMNAMVLAKHQLSKETFFTSFSYYQEHPALMDSIYRKVVDGLNADLTGIDQKRDGGKQLPPPALK